MVMALTAGLLLALAPWMAPATARAEVRTGDRAAEFIAVKDKAGKRIKLKSYRGKLVVLTFGASWCQPCKKELPAWDKLAGQYKEKGVVFMAVNIDKELAKGEEFIGKAKLKVMRALYEPEGATVESYDPPSMPTTFVIDKKGVVRFVHAGFRSGDEKTLAAELDKLIGK